MLAPAANPPLETPDDPLKWDGWSKYKAANPYERLCLDPRSRPDNEQIQQHCAALLQWWQKKLRLKNQPSNPLTQLLGRGLDEAAQYLVEARVLLLDRVRRQQIDDELAVRAEQDKLAEFSKYVAFSLARRVLTPEAEANLREFGINNGLSEEQTRGCIEEELRRHKAQRATTAPPAAKLTAKPGGEAETEFLRILQLGELGMSDATALVRQIFGTIAQNLGIPLERAECLLDDYIEDEEYRRSDEPAPAPPPRVQPVARTAVPVSPNQPSRAPSRAEPGVLKTPADLPQEFTNPAGGPMVLIPAGEFIMGSDAEDAGLNEQPLTPVALSAFYMSRFVVTNGEYERFDPVHRQKRMRGAGDTHPVVHVSSIEAVRYCNWLGQQDGKTYRLPTEAEWEYAARGTDGRKYPWGNDCRRHDLANFADASTTFPWREVRIHDGYPETSPVGVFPAGASVFGIHDMAGNVWEWCLDFYQPLSGEAKRNPRGLASGRTRIYRGGSWKSRYTSLRTSARSSNEPNYASNDVGFRVVCECPSAESNGSSYSGAAAVDRLK